MHLQSLMRNGWPRWIPCVAAAVMTFTSISHSTTGAPSRSDGSTQVFASRDVRLSIQNPCFVGNSRLMVTEFSSYYNNGDASIDELPAGGGSTRRVVYHAGHDAVDLPGACFNELTGRIAFSSDLIDTDNIWTALPGTLNDSEHRVTCLTVPYLHAEEPSWSPNGQWLTYEVDDDHDADRVSIHKIPATNTCAHPHRPTLLVSGSSPSSSINQEPNWSPNGRWILFQRETDFASGNLNLWMITPSGTDLTRVTDDPDSDADASWAPSSTSIVYSTNFDAPTGNAGTNLFIVVAAAVGRKVRLTSQCYYDGAPSWSPDGNWVSFETALVVDNTIRRGPRYGASRPPLDPALHDVDESVTNRLLDHRVASVAARVLEVRDEGCAPQGYRSGSCDPVVA